MSPPFDIIHEDMGDLIDVAIKSERAWLHKCADNGILWGEVLRGVDCPICSQPLCHASTTSTRNVELLQSIQSCVDIRAGITYSVLAHITCPGQPDDEVPF